MNVKSLPTLRDIKTSLQEKTIPFTCISQMRNNRATRTSITWNPEVNEFWIICTKRQHDSFYDRPYLISTVLGKLFKELLETENTDARSAPSNKVIIPLSYCFFRY